MSSRSIARRYARALFEVSIDADMKASIAQLGLVAAHPLLKEVLQNPSLAAEVKLTILTKAVKAELSAELQRLLKLLAQREKLILLPEIAELYDELCVKALNECVVDVHVASALSATVEKQLLARLQELTGQSVTLNVRIDESVLGGILLQVGDRQIDATVRGRLQSLRRAVAA